MRGCTVKEGEGGENPDSRFFVPFCEQHAKWRQNEINPVMLLTYAAVEEGNNCDNGPVFIFFAGKLCALSHVFPLSVTGNVKGYADISAVVISTLR
ncbi:hypothetical protein CEG88_15970 [Klebsiella aerogenes]|nr:hypothetical protein YA28_02920 [Klebsiella aerogenes]KUQ19832.1 hypothetical protein AWI09_01185 [Klebsiella aerogenes]KUR11961.1 hypothetical protein AWI35_03455 [Klebsiella aerogenes]KZR01908.1 hypothetical protein A3N63_10670 [Klebsiella aerogenes]OWP41252.1 hypothetical protein CEG88_15970 [Klebsiella aerogenes]